VGSSLDVHADPGDAHKDVARWLAPGALLAGRYRILDLLGAGGMGMVHRAEDQQLGLIVAVKVLRPELARDGLWIGRFKQELLLARQVSHANVVRIHDIGIDGDLAFLTMDFVPGRSLGELLGAETRLAPERAVEIARQVALGLEAAHQAGVVHRDIKPRNVLVDETGGAVRVAITDFGIARSLAGSGLTLPGTIVGTLGYLSPEQARGDSLDGRSDLYTLGILIYEMLTGRLPLAGATVTEMLAQGRSGAARNLAWPDEVRPPLRAVVRRLLEPDAARRTQSAGEAVRDLERLQASPPRWPRRRLAVAAACLLFLLAGLGLAVRAWAPWRHPPGAGSRPAVVAGPRSAVALLPFADDTGRRDLAWVATGMPEMLAAALAESPNLRVLDSPRVLHTLEDLKLPRGPLPDADARRLAGLLDADHLVSGRVYAEGGRLRIDLSLLATSPPGAAPATLHVEAGEGEAFLLVEQLAGVLYRRLAVPAAASAELAPSRSPVALAEYSRGVASLRSGDALEAVPALEKAVAADPRCTAAWVELARARQALGRAEPARQAARRAVETLGSAESRAAYEAHAVEERLLGHPDRAQEILTRLVARYPDDVEARIELAEAYGEQGSLDRAIASLREAVRQAPHHPRAWYLLGKYSILAGDARHAVDEHLVRALVVQNELRNEQGRADVLNAFGVGYRKLGEMDRAVESYEAAAAIRKRIGDERGYATTLRNLADLQMMRGEQTAAQARLEEALAILQRLGDPTGTADLYNDFGVLAEQRGDYAEALERYQQALRARRNLGNDLALAQSFGNVGFASFLLGRYDDALVYWRQALDLARKSGDPGGEVQATQNLGQLELARGEWDAAVKSFLTALATSREIGMKETIPISLWSLGRLAQYQGRPGAAMASYEEALKVQGEIGDRQGIAEVDLALAETALELGMTTAADERLRAAGQVLAGEKNRGQQAELDRLRGELLLARGERAAAVTALRLAVSEAVESHSVAVILAARLSAAGLEGRPKAALAALETLRAQADGLGNARLRLRADESVARAALAAGEARRAQAAVRAGLELAASCGGYAGSHRLHRILADALERDGRRAEAVEERRLAGEEIARLRRDLAPEPRKLFDHMLATRNGTAPGVRAGESVARGTATPDG
jgi:eukaryotic-like serine/threonine-protein kinase